MCTAAAEQIIETCITLDRTGINQGNSGNVSVRTGGGFLITPSAVACSRLHPEDLVALDMEGHWTGQNQPSSEWRLHRDIYRTRRDAGAVIHAHPTYCTALACQRRAIPPFHYMIAVAGGKDIRCSRYALFGTQALSDTMLTALDSRRACLLANHGMICFHDDLETTLWLAVEVEALARQYWHACQQGEVILLTDQEMEQVMERFESYGKIKIESMMI